MTSADAPRSDLAPVLEASRAFLEVLSSADRQLRKSRLTIPPAELRDQATAAFWAMMETVTGFEQRGPSTKADRDAFREGVGEWMLVFRTEEETAALFDGHDVAVETQVSDNGALVYARARKRRAPTGEP